MLFACTCRRILITAALLLAASAAGAYAGPVLGKLLPLWQPDGERIEVRVWGDEFYTVVESLDGYTLVRDAVTGYVCYARLSADGNELVSTGVPVGRSRGAALRLPQHVRINPEAVKRQARAAREAFRRQLEAEGASMPRYGGRTRPTTGEVLGLCLIIDFSDDEATIPRDEVDNYCNQVGYTGFGNVGSVRDYFYDVSNELLTYTNYVPAEYYRAAHPKSYYTDPNIAYGVRARQLITEALTYLNNNGLDYSQFDADDDGVVDAVNCYYAGYSNSAWATGLWPHAGGITYCTDGVCVTRYQMTDMQDELTLFTFCHENGHMLMGWPDLYDYDYDSTGVGQFCLMCYGTTDKNPCEPCAYMKLNAGWANLTVITAPQQGIQVPSAASNVVYQFPHPTLSNEYYLVENRQKMGRDFGLPDAGLAIWHVDTEGNNSDNQQTPEEHFLVTLVQADGEWDLEHNRNYGDNTDLYAAPSYTACTPETYPNTNWWSGEPSTIYIKNISQSMMTMTFDYLDGPDCNNNGIPDYADVANCTGEPWCSDCNGNGQMDVCDIAEYYATDCNGNGRPDDCDLADGTSLDCNGNHWPDECDIAGGGAVDDNDNLVPDVCEYHPADTNCDGVVSFGDINPFVQLLANWVVYLQKYPNCIRLNGDINGDGVANFGDINPFVTCIVNGGCP